MSGLSALRARPPRALLCAQIAFADLEKNTPPEMQRTNLAAIVLQLKARGRQLAACNGQRTPCK
jgi:HrpA-like RNA helicase